MGALRRVRCGLALLTVAVAVTAAVAVTGCEPRDAGVNSVAVAVTMDRVGTRALEKGGIDVRWMTCNADLKGHQTAGASPPRDLDASVHCRGRTVNGKDIKITGRVTSVRENHCVRGDLTGTVGGHRVFEAQVIGECDGGRETRRPEPTRTHPWDHRTSAASGKGK